MALLEHHEFEHSNTPKTAVKNSAVMGIMCAMFVKFALIDARAYASRMEFLTIFLAVSVPSDSQNTVLDLDSVNLDVRNERGMSEVFPRPEHESHFQWNINRPPKISPSIDFNAGAQRSLYASSL